MIDTPRRPVALAACLLFLAACGGEDSNAPQANPAAGAALPALDRSSDLAGPDRDGDGIRDDVAAWIDQQAFDAPRRAAMRQMARALQAAIVSDPNNPDAVHANSWLGTSAVACVMTRLPDGASRVARLRGITANTEARTRAYLAYSAALDGSVLSLPQGDGCEE
jgi:hypothetical protein